MVAYQGELDFAHQGSGGMGRFLKKSLTGEGAPLMKVSGRGDLFLADDSCELHLITLEGDSVTVNGRNVLAFDSALTWDIKKVEGASMLAGESSIQSSLGPGRSRSPPMARPWS